MRSSFFAYAAAAAALVSVASAQTYLNNTNTNCATRSDVALKQTYYYDPNDTEDWGLYTQSTGTCDSGSYARVHVLDPSGNDIDCGYVALDGVLHLTSCSNYPRGYMQEGDYTIYWETVPASGIYSWNQFSVIHSQNTVTAPVPTQNVTTTPVSIITATVTSTPTTTLYQSQVTVTTPSATMTNTINITPTTATITTTSTSYYSIVMRAYAQTTVTAVTTAACSRAPITPDYSGKRNTGSSNSNTGTTKSTTSTSTTSSFNFWAWLFPRGVSRIQSLQIRDDVPNSVGIIGQPLTTTITPSPVISTYTAATTTSTVTSVTNAAAVTVTSVNPTPTLTVYSGIAVSTITTTLPQPTKSVIKTKLSVTYVTTTFTLTYTKKVVTTPLCAPTGA